MMKLQLKCVHAALVAGCALFGGTSHALDLVGSFEQALAFDPATRAAAEGVQAGREKAVQGRALLLPQVSLSGELAYVDDRSSTSLPEPLKDIIKPQSSGAMHQAAIQVVQPLYNQKAVADRDQMQKQTDLAEIRFVNAKQDLMQKVAESYFSVLLAREVLHVTGAEKAAVTLQRDRAQARFAVGRGKITDVQETQARYDSVLTKEISARSTLSLREAQYLELTGATDAALTALRTDFAPTPTAADDLAAWQAKSRERNAQVQMRQAELVIAGAETRKYTLSARPTLDFVASYGVKGQNGSLSPTISPDNNRMAAVGVQLSIPLYTGGAIDSKQRESLAKERQAEQELSAARRDARLSVQDAWLAVRTGIARIGSLEQSVRSAQTALEATTLGRDVGTRIDLDVLDAQQRLFQVQLDLAQARNDYLLARVRLARATGELNERDLRELNAFLATTRVAAASASAARGS
jgi:outer membrane protein